MENKQLKLFKDLKVWQKAVDLATLVYLNSTFFLIVLYSIFYILNPVKINAAALSLSPATGAFTVDSVFNVSLFLDTKGEAINAVDIRLLFPSDKIQLVSPTTGRSIISLWTSQPNFNNQEGSVGLQGVIPGGINVSSGLITELTFRVKSVGAAVVKFSDQSRTLLHDGLGTDVLQRTTNGVYSLILPPPMGPIVASETHPDQSLWYSNSTVLLKWSPETEANGYSYILNKDPVDAPDDISEGIKESVVYKNVGDGTHYFHIKSLRQGVWGGVTHFAVNIDTVPPAEFPVEIMPSRRTDKRNPIISFMTTDGLSGIDHYELKIISLTQPSGVPAVNGGQPLFIEASSPYIASELELGTYDIIIRAHDKAGNWREVMERLEIVRPIFKFIANRGLEIKGLLIVPWIWVWVAAGILILSLGFLARIARRWHYRVHARRTQKEMPNYFQEQLSELKKYRKKYGHLVLVFLVVGATLFFSRSYILAQQIGIGPPFISSISRNISNEEIFYIGGKTEAANSKVIIYIQNLQSGETVSENIDSNSKGDWFYRHNTFLSSGNYLLWTQSKVGEEMSPPSPQIQMTIRPTAIQFGASRLSYEAVYLGIVVFLFLIFLGLVVYIVFHSYHGRKKHKQFMKEVKEAEESLRRGFAVLRRDIEAELAIVRRAKFNKELSAEEKIKERQLLKDLEWAQRYIGKEIWDIEKSEHFD